MRIGIDLGGTKIEAIALDESGALLARRRVATPRHDYDGTLEAIAALVRGPRAADGRLRHRGHRHSRHGLPRDAGW